MRWNSRSLIIWGQKSKFILLPQISAKILCYFTRIATLLSSHMLLLSSLICSKFFSLAPLSHHSVESWTQGWTKMTGQGRSRENNTEFVIVLVSLVSRTRYLSVLLFDRLLLDINIKQQKIPESKEQD